MVTKVRVCTGLVVIVKLARLLPAGTVTEGGTCATPGLLLDSATELPPWGATTFRVTVPVEFCPPFSDPGESVSDVIAGGFTVRTTVLTDCPLEAVRVTWVITETAEVVTVNVALLAPSGTVTLAGTRATAGLLDERFTRMPP